MSLQASFNSFRDDNQNAAARNAQFLKRQNGSTASSTTAKPIASTPSPRPSTPALSAPSSDLKRKRPDLPENVTYSQPQDTGSGGEVVTQMVYAVDWLKKRNSVLASFEDIWSFLSLKPEQQAIKPLFRRALLDHPKVEVVPGGITGKDGKTRPGFRFRPLHNISSADELKAYLQSQKTAQGIKVPELKEGWPEAVAVICDLEEKGELLVTRKKKDNAPSMVWANDPSLALHISEDFQNYWNKIKLPSNVNDMRNELEKAGLTPTSQVKEVAKIGGTGQKKKRISRKLGRSTNLHMTGILKDYSQVKK